MTDTKETNQRPVARPNAKTQKRLEARLKDWENTTGKLKTKGHQKPGSQQKSRCE